jgi:hypothetical protein
MSLWRALFHLRHPPGKRPVFAAHRLPCEEGEAPI